MAHIFIRAAVVAAFALASLAPAVMAQDASSSASDGLDDFTRAQANQALQCVGVYDYQIAHTTDAKALAELNRLRTDADLAFRDYADVESDGEVADLYPQEDKMVADNIAARNGDISELTSFCDQMYRGSDQ